MKKQFESPISIDILVLVLSLLTTFLLWHIASTFPREQIPVYVFTTGILASFLLFVTVFGLSRAEKKATAADEEHWRFISAIESLPLGLVITDLTGEIVLSNYRLSTVLGGLHDKLTLKDLDMRLKGSFSVASACNEVLETRRSFPWRKVTIGKKEIEIYLAPVFSEENGLLGVLILFRD